MLTRRFDSRWTLISRFPLVLIEQVSNKATSVANLGRSRVLIARCISWSTCASRWTTVLTLVESFVGWGIEKTRCREPRKSTNDWHCRRSSRRKQRPWQSRADRSTARTNRERACETFANFYLSTLNLSSDVLKLDASRFIRRLWSPELFEVAVSTCLAQFVSLREVNKLYYGYDLCLSRVKDNTRLVSVLPRRRMLYPEVIAWTIIK